MNLYLDASAIVKLFFEEPGSQVVEESVARAERNGTSMISYVEVRAALARREREGSFLSGTYLVAVSEFERGWPDYRIVELEAPIARMAGDLAQTRALRALDALHLASALFLKDSGVASLSFLSADRRLRAAAQAEGLNTIVLG